MKFKIGDKIKIIQCVLSDGPEPGSVGTIRYMEADFYAVEFESKFPTSHDCGGYFNSDCGWWVLDSECEKANNYRWRKL